METEDSIRITEKDSKDIVITMVSLDSHFLVWIFYRIFLLMLFLRFQNTMTGVNFPIISSGVPTRGDESVLRLRDFKKIVTDSPMRPSGVFWRRMMT